MCRRRTSASSSLLKSKPHGRTGLEGVKLQTSSLRETSVSNFQTIILRPSLCRTSEFEDSCSIRSCKHKFGPLCLKRHPVGLDGRAERFVGSAARKGYFVFAVLAFPLALHRLV